MQKRKIIILIIGVVILSGVAIAGTRAGWFNTPVINNELPDAKDEFERISDRMKADTSLNLAGTITLYDGEKPAEVKEKATCRYIRKGYQFYSQLGYLQTFSDGKLIVQLDTVNQMIAVAKVATGKRERKRMMQPSLDMLFDENADFGIIGKVTQTNEHERTIVLQSDFNPEVKSYALTYDPATYRVSGAVIQWWKDGGAIKETMASNKVWISHIDYQQSPASDLDIHEAINNIITINKDGVAPALLYQAYQLQVTNPEQ